MPRMHACFKKKKLNALHSLLNGLSRFVMICLRRDMTCQKLKREDRDRSSNNFRFVYNRSPH